VAALAGGWSVPGHRIRRSGVSLDLLAKVSGPDPNGLFCAPQSQRECRWLPVWVLAGPNGSACRPGA